MVSSKGVELWHTPLQVNHCSAGTLFVQISSLICSAISRRYGSCTLLVSHSAIVAWVCIGLAPQGIECRGKHQLHNEGWRRKYTKTLLQNGLQTGANSQPKAQYFASSYKLNACTILSQLLMSPCNSSLRFKEAERWCGLGMSFLKHLSPQLKANYEEQVCLWIARSQ